MIYLKEANLEDALKEYAFIKGLPEDENGFTNPHWGVSEEAFMQTVLPRMLLAPKGIGLPEGYVPETDFFLWEGDQIVGLFRLRHELNDYLRDHAGHVGYGIRQDCRGRGLATLGLKLLIEKARKLIRENEIYLSVNRDNLASLRVQEKNGAYIHHSDEQRHYTRIRL
ncbi:MAG: GNAT family N-acetyltransferase [Clostridia bacterium]|nr:GNAT family N-acetyltransferase [Clostridia bacterium]